MQYWIIHRHELADIYTWYATTASPTSTTYAPIAESQDTLIDRAIAAEGAHTITSLPRRAYASMPSIPNQSTCWQRATSRRGLAPGSCWEHDTGGGMHVCTIMGSVVSP